MWYRIWYRIKKKSRKNSPSTIELISLDIYISSFNFTLLRIEGNNLQNYSTYSPTYSLSSDRINSLLLFPKRVARFLSKLAAFLFENNSVQIVLSPSQSPFIDRYSFRHNSLFRNPDYGQRLFQFDRFTWWPQDRLKSRIFLVYHDLHSNFLESRNLFAFQVRTPHFRSILFIH